MPVAPMSRRCVPCRIPAIAAQKRAIASTFTTFAATHNAQCLILPRQGEVSPKVTEGEDTEPTSSLPPPPSGFACHLPLAGED